MRLSALAGERQQRRPGATQPERQPIVPVWAQGGFAAEHRVGLRDTRQTGAGAGLPDQPQRFQRRRVTVKR